MMKQLLPGIWQWSWFSEEKKLDFNGLFLTIGEHRILVDPPPMASDDLTQARRSGPIDYILVTNRDHERESSVFQRDFACQVWVPDVDAPQMTVKADKTYKDGELLAGGIWAIHLADQKSPGECALFIQQGKGIMVLGDALIGKPPGSVAMLPADRFADPAKAREGLKRLLKYNFDALLVGDGSSIMTGAKPVVEQFLNS